MNKKLIFEKGIAGIIGAYFMDKWKLLFPVIMLFTILMIVDYISGMLVAKKEALEHPNDQKYGWSSKMSIIGIYKKFGYILIILVAVCTDYILYKFSSEIGIKFEYNTMFGLLMCIWLIINELLSILENAGRLGAKLPKTLKKILAEVKNNVDGNDLF